MTRYLILLLLFTLNIPCVQGQKMPEDYWQEAKRAEYSGKDTAAALTNYLQIVNNYPNHPLSPMASISVGKVYEEQGKLPEAITAYRSAIATALTMDIHQQLTRFHEIFDGDYAACRLYKLYDERGRYDSALYYLGIRDTIFSGMHGCDTYDDLDIMAKYADLDIKTGRIRDAETILLKNIGSVFTMEKLSQLYAANEQPQQLKTEIEAAINNYVLDTVAENNNGCTDTAVYITFSFRSISMGSFIIARRSGNIIYDNAGGPESTTREGLIAYLKRHELYTLIQAL